MSNRPAALLAARQEMMQMLDGVLAQHRLAAASASSTGASAAEAEAIRHLLQLDLPDVKV